ncbi:right-handed parallel beta-helix repeat-containing protein [Sunxiuqinia sp. sy24]|uniref:right-handed parallel beta-helix repeat-containing protein n=1 Tax=Sunxiuqinia sp. sy24 TaxID=3461495 RepID=UPI004045F8FB
MKKCLIILVAFVLYNSAFAKEYHVSKSGNNNNDGSALSPLKTISAAAQIAQPGDVITVHEGIYRERVNPSRGGTSDSQRITYRAAKGEKVEIKGSEAITGWQMISKGVWKVTIPNTFFGDYNPYKDLITGDWFHRLGRDHHTGEVYLNGKSLYEMDLIERVFNPQPLQGIEDQKGSTYTWYCESDEQNTYLFANFHDFNPNEELVEINVRENCFYPDSTGCNYITVTGFHMSQAATQWAAPTAEQIGLIGTNWSKGWIIENNVVSNSKCTGITLGKDRKSGHNTWSADNNKGRDGNEHYIKVVKNVIKNGWDRETIGSHIVRNNTISDCEQAGICGSLGAIFSHVSGNHIYNIWTKRMFSGFEIAGIKFHAPIDVVIEKNRIHNACRGMWMDWMTQGTRLSGNLCYDNSDCDLFSEVNHGPYLVANNIFLSEDGIKEWSVGGAYVHNLVAGRISTRSEWRATPYFKPHSTDLVDIKDIPGGDNRFYNNIFSGDGLDKYEKVKLPMHVNGNAYLNGAKPYEGASNNVVKPGFDPKIKIIEEGESVFLEITLDKSCTNLKNKLVTTELLGKAMIPEQAYENPDGSALKIDRDYFGTKRNRKNPSAGPFKNPGIGRIKLKVW